MRKRLILDSEALNITLNRLCQHLIENHDSFEDSVIIGLQPRGKFLAEEIHKRLEKNFKKKIKTGLLDITYYRDDFRRRETPVKANKTNISFVIEDRNVILIDDVIYTGRSIRAAMDAMIAFGRPRTVELLVLVNRKYSRDLPIEPDYIGIDVNTISSQKVMVEWESGGQNKNGIWLIDNPEENAA